MEGGALVGSAGGPDAASVVVDDAATYCEAETRAALGSGVGGVALVEAVEDVLDLVGGDAGALVADFDECFVAVEVAGTEVNLAANWGELDGVGDEVAEGLKDAVRVGPDTDALSAKKYAGGGFWCDGLLHSGGATEEVFGAAHGWV